MQLKAKDNFNKWEKRCDGAFGRPAGRLSKLCAVLDPAFRIE